MILVTPSVVAAAIGMKCGGSAPADTDESFLSVLSILTGRLEDMMSVDTLSYGEFLDYFDLAYAGVNKLQLRNGFLIKDDPVSALTDPYGNVVEPGTYDIDTNYGIITINTGVTTGRYSVQYESGFKATKVVPTELVPTPNQDYAVAINVPKWFNGLIDAVMVRWFRNIQASPRAPKEISLFALNSALNREIYSLLYMRYMRPRSGVQFVAHRGSVD